MAIIEQATIADNVNSDRQFTEVAWFAGFGATVDIDDAVVIICTADVALVTGACTIVVIAAIVVILTVVVIAAVVGVSIVDVAVEFVSV